MFLGALQLLCKLYLFGKIERKALLQDVVVLSLLNYLVFKPSSDSLAPAFDRTPIAHHPARSTRLARYCPRFPM